MHTARQKLGRAHAAIERRLVELTMQSTEIGDAIMTQSEPTTLTDRLAEDREFQDRAKRTQLLIQQNIEKSLEQNLADLNRLDRWVVSPWVLFVLGMIAGGALVVLGALFMKFVILAQ